MPISAYILIAVALHLAAFVSYPQSGRFGFTFLYISIIMWSAFAIFINSAANHYGKAWKAGVLIVFTLACAFSSLAFLPQTDGSGALHKFLLGRYPDRKVLYYGFLRIGIDIPALRPPQKEEPLP